MECGHAVQRSFGNGMWFAPGRSQFLLSTRTYQMKLTRDGLRRDGLMLVLVCLPKISSYCTIATQKKKTKKKIILGWRQQAEGVAKKNV